MNAIEKAITDVMVYIRTNLRNNEHICADPTLYQLITLSGAVDIDIIAGALYQLYVSEGRTVIEPHAHVFMRADVQDAVIAIQRNNPHAKRAIEACIAAIQNRQMVNKWAAQGRPVINLR